MSTTVPANEALRLQALHALGVLDTPADAGFDAVVESALRFCQTPIAALSLVDEDRQWFKSSYGLDVAETPREVAFCAHTIVGDDLFVVEDASTDARFCDNPLVTGAPHIRFYAGVPVLVGPQRLALGSLCVIDSVTRCLTAQQQQRLKTSAALLAVMLARQTPELATPTLVQAISEPLLLVCGQQLAANPAACELTGYCAKELSRLGLTALLKLDWPSAESAIITRALRQRRYADTQTHLVHQDGRELTCEVQIFPLPGPQPWLALLLSPLPAHSLSAFFSALQAPDRQMLLSLSVDSFWATDTEMRLTEVAGSAFRGADYEHVAQAFGKRTWEFPFVDHSSTDFHVLKEALARRQPFRNFEYALQWLGRRVWLSVSGYPVFDAEGQFAGYRGTNRDISDKKAMQEALLKNEELLRMLANNSGDGLAVIEQGRLVYASPSYVKLLGYSESDEIGRDEANIAELIHPDDRQRILTYIYSQIAEQRADCCYSMRLRHAQGHYIWREDATRFIYDDKGALLRSIVVARDITARVQIEEKLERLTQILKQTERIAHIGGWELMLDSMTVHWTDEVFAILALERSEPPTLEQAIRFYTPASQVQIVAAVENAITHGTPWDLELEVITARGQARWVRTMSQVVLQQGRVQRVFGSIQDVTREVTARHATQEQQRLLQQCFDNILPGIAVLSNTGILYCNLSLRLLLGFTASEPLDQLSIRRIISGKDRKFLRQRQSLAQRLGEPASPALLALTRKDQRRITCLIHLSSINWNGVTRMLASISPLSEADMVEVEIRATQDRYEKMLIGQLEEQHAAIAREIHDSLGANLVGISMMISSLQQCHANLATELAPVLSHLQQSIESCRNLSRGLMPVDDEPGSFWRMMELLCQDYAQFAGVACQFSMNGNLEHIPHETANHLYRIAQEALANAVKHGRARLITLHLEEHRGNCLLSIQDDGIGMAAACAERTRAPGIGMKTMRARARMFDGTLEFGSSESGGVSVSVGWRSVMKALGRKRLP